MNYIGNWLYAILVAVSAIAGLYGYVKVPGDKMIAVHFNMSGVPDGFAPAYFAFFVIPLIGLAIIGALAVQVWTDPAGRAIRGSASVVVLLVQVALCAGQLFILFRALKG